MLFFTTCFSVLLQAQNFEFQTGNKGPAFTIKSNEKDSNAFIISEFNWARYRAGNDTSWANPSFNDSSWDSTQFISEELNNIAPDLYKSIWFRWQFKLPAEVFDPGISIDQIGASEIYLDGKLIQRYGDINSKTGFNPQGLPLNLTVNSNTDHVLAIRYVNPSAKLFKEEFGYDDSELRVKVDSMKALISEYKDRMFVLAISLILLTGIFITLSLNNVVLFLFHQREKANLYYAVFTGSLASIFVAVYISNSLNNSNIIIRSGFYIDVIFPIMFFSLLAMVYSLFKKPVNKFLIITLVAVSIHTLLVFIKASWAEILSGGIGITISIGVIVICLKEGFKKYPKIYKSRKVIFYTFLALIGLGIVGSVFKWKISIFLLIAIFGTIALLILGSIFIIPLIMSIYHARKFSSIAKNLELQLLQVKDLSEKTILQEKEKQKLIEGQKEKLEVEVVNRTREVVEQKKQIEEKNKDITDSINYAKRIQKAILPDIETIQNDLRESFVLYQPKDIVSGDFYFYSKVDDKIIIAAADCTGHGVPGAFMSMIGHNLLHQITVEEKIIAPSTILNELNQGIKKALKQGGEKNYDEETRDGMDIALCTISLKDKNMVYAGAQRPLYLIRNKELTEYKANKKSIGGSVTGDTEFLSVELGINKGDVFYIFSDGYADQFGGEYGKKFMTKRLKEFLLKISDEAMIEQENLLRNEIENWRGTNGNGKPFEQVDDILIIGIKF